MYFISGDSGITENWCHYIVSDFFIAGLDTVSTTLQWSLLYMTSFPEIKKKIHNEIDQVNQNTSWKNNDIIIIDVVISRTLFVNEDFMGESERIDNNVTRSVITKQSYDDDRVV